MSADEGRHLVSNFSEVNRNQDFLPIAQSKIVIKQSNLSSNITINSTHNIFQAQLVGSTVIIC